MDFMVGVVPVYGDSEVACSVPVFFDVIMLLEDLEEMVDVFLANLLNAEVINHKCETDWTPCVFPVAGGYFGLRVAGFA
jgi:hypothetical protein